MRILLLTINHARSSLLLDSFRLFQLWSISLDKGADFTGVPLKKSASGTGRWTGTSILLSISRGCWRRAKSKASSSYSIVSIIFLTAMDVHHTHIDHQARRFSSVDIQASEDTLEESLALSGCVLSTPCRPSLIAIFMIGFTSEGPGWDPQDRL